MDLKDILVCLDETEAAERRLRLAKNLALQHGACLSAAFFPLGSTGPQGKRETAAPWLGLVSGAPVSGGITVPEAEDSVYAAEERLQDRMTGCRKGEAWFSPEAADLDALIAVAQSADLIIAGQVHPGQRSATKWRPEELVVRCGRPVLMVPYIGDYVRVGQHVVVAWDASREAARALNDALPLLAEAKTATLATVYSTSRERDQMRTATARMVRHLDRHGITAQTDEISRLGGSAADLILSRSVDLSADLLVAGAHHHSQWHEAVFGGVSRELFRHMTLPVLMSY